MLTTSLLLQLSVQPGGTGMASSACLNDVRTGCMYVCMFYSWDAPVLRQVHRH